MKTSSLLTTCLLLAALPHAGVANTRPLTTADTRPATLLAAVADVTTTLTGPTTLGAGVSSGTYTVTFTNNGPGDAFDVTQLVALPAGSTLSTAQRAALPGTAVYNGSTNVINFGSAVLAKDGFKTYTFSFTSPTTQGAGFLTSTVGTSSN